MQTKGTVPTGTWAYDPLMTNRIVGQIYDSNGNQTNGGYWHYDIENRLTSLTNNGTQDYAYGAGNQRVYHATYNVQTLTAKEVYFYGIDGQKLGVYSLLNGTSIGHQPMLYLGATQLNVYFAGKFVGRSAKPIGSAGSVAFNSTTPDRIGSLGKYYPYGEERGTITANDQEKFATYTRDSATGLDYANQRYYSNTQARFMSPDPYRASGGLGDPGSWNRYAYVGGDPINRYDPSGLYEQALPGCRPGSGGGGECGSPPSGQSGGYIPFEPPSQPDPLIGAGPNPSGGNGQTGRGGGSRKTGGWDNELASLSDGIDLVSKLLVLGDLKMTPACQKDFDAISAATGIASFQIFNTINGQNWVNGATTTATVCSAETTADASGYDFYCNKHPSFTFQQLYSQSSNNNIGAISALPGSASVGSVFFNPNFLSDTAWTAGFAAALLIHESFHTLGALDGTVLGALGYDPKGSSGQITTRIQSDCLKGQ